MSMTTKGQGQGPGDVVPPAAGGVSAEAIAAALGTTQDVIQQVVALAERTKRAETLAQIVDRAAQRAAELDAADRDAVARAIMEHVDPLKDKANKNAWRRAQVLTELRALADAASAGQDVEVPALEDVLRRMED